MPGPVKQLRRRGAYRRHLAAEMARDLGHRLVVFVVLAVLVGLALRAGGLGS
jgi:hypothetical protein